MDGQVDTALMILTFTVDTPGHTLIPCQLTDGVRVDTALCWVV